MPRAAVTKNYFQFNKGLITEATGLSFPENSMLAAVNVDLNYDGSVSRRKGLKIEESLGSLGLGDPVAEGIVVQKYVWKNAGTALDKEILAVKYGSALVFYDLSSSNLALLGSVSLGSPTSKVSFASGNGYLLVAAGGYPKYVEYDGVDFTVTDIYPKIRDFDGISYFQDTPHKRPTTLPTDQNFSFYLYNLLNQGWPAKMVRNAAGTPQEAWIIFETVVGSFPAYSDRYQPEGDKYNPIGEKILDPSTSDPSLGRFVLDMFNIDRAAALDSLTDASYTVDTIVRNDLETYHPAEIIEERPTVIGFYQGHAVLGGISNKRYASQIFFSQSVRKKADLSKYYSVNDPTADIESSPLDTDGGSITINGLGKLIKLEEYGPWLIVFADNGVWAIRSDNDSVFSVNSATVTKVSEVGAINDNAIVNVDSSILYWADKGIYALSADQSSLSLSVQSISEVTVDTLYKNIPAISKRFADVCYDKFNSKVYWMYNSTLTSESGFTSFYDKALVLDLRLQAFYEHHFPTVDTDNTLLGAAVYKRDLSFSEEVFNIVAGSDNVIASSDNVVFTAASATSSNDQSIIFFAYPTSVFGSGYVAAFATLSDRDFIDWADQDGDYFDSYVETGYETLESPANVKSIGSLHCYFNRTEERFVSDGAGGITFDYPSSCLMTAKWEWTNTGTANRWSTPQQVYRLRVPFISGGDLQPFDYDYSVITTRNKVRGKGKAVVLRFESEDGKDFQLLGWSVEYSAGAKI